MEESKILENLENLPADKMKAPNAHDEIKKLVSNKPSQHEKVFKPVPGIPTAEKGPEAKKVILPEAVSTTSKLEQKLQETASVKTPKMEQTPHIQPQKEPNPKDSTAAKDKTNSLKVKPPLKDHQVKGTEEADQQQDDSKDTPPAVKEKKEKSEKSKSKAEKKPARKKDQPTTREERVDTQQLESYRQESVLEEDSRKTWRSLLTEVTHVSSLSAFKLLFDKTSSTSESFSASVRKRAAKQLYKRKIKVLRENYTYRLGLLKQLKESMKNRYNSEAQQLYSDYTSMKREQRFHKTTNTLAEDSKESKVTDPSEVPVADTSGLAISDSVPEPGHIPAAEDKFGA